MKRIAVTLLVVIILLATGSVACAETLESTQIDDLQQIGSLCRVRTYSGEEYVVDSENNVLGGPYKYVSDNSGYCSAQAFDGTKVMFDLDGTILATVSENYDINPPSNGIYTIRECKEGDEAELVVYDYETNDEILRTTGTFLYYLEHQSEKMFIKSNGKYAIVDNKCNFITDYIYDDVKKRFNPEYVPFPKAYAIVVQDGVEKHIDWNLNKIDLNDYNGEVFITNCYPISPKYKNYYVLESGERLALYDMDTDKILIPYQTEYKFLNMNDKYIIVEKGEEQAVIDYLENIVVSYSKSVLHLEENGQISYSHYDGETMHKGVLNPEDGQISAEPLGWDGMFYQVIGETDMDNIAFGTIVSGDVAADIREEDLDKFLEVYWNFGYERVISPYSEYYNNQDTYIKLWNEDKTKSYIIYPHSGLRMGRFGEPSWSHGVEKINYLWYMPLFGNGRNALYTAFETVRHTYFDKDFEGYVEVQREVTEQDKAEPKKENILPIDGASDWAKPEVQKAAACNLLIYDLTDKYTEDITRYDFCRLAYRLIATEFDPTSDSRAGLGTTIDNILSERGIKDAYINKFTDCYYGEVEVLASMGIIEGMGDGTFAPDERITREQAAAILFRMAVFLGNKTIPKEVLGNWHYHDMADVSHWAQDSVGAVYIMDIMRGGPDGNFYPQDNYTIEQAIATMLRLYECY